MQKTFLNLFATSFLFACLFSLPNQTHASLVSKSPVNSLTSGLVGYWTFDGKDTNWATNKTNDLSGNDNTGPLTNMSTTTSPVKGKMGQGLRFNGSTQSILIGSASTLNITSSVTVSAWVKFSIVPGFYKGIVGRGVITTGSSNAQYALSINASGKLSFLVGSGSTQYRAGEDIIPVAMQWYHLVGVYNSVAQTISLYVNGQLDKATIAGPASLNGGTLSGYGSVVLGKPYAQDYYLNGSLDDVRVYSRALSATEVRQLYNLGQVALESTPAVRPNVNSLDSGLVGWWTFNNQDMNWATGKALDKSGNVKNGQLLNMATTTNPVAGKLGQALKFDGINDNVSIGSVSASVSSMAFWIKLATSTTQTILDLDGGTHSASTTNGSFTANGFASPTYYIDGKTTASPTIDTKWHYVVVTTATPINANNVKLGVVGSSYFGGTLEDVRLYSRVLSVAEIRQLYLSGQVTLEATQGGVSYGCSQSSLNCGLVGYWTFNNQDMNWATGKVFDKSGSGNDGQLISMSTTTTPVQGKLGQGLGFDGTNDYINAGTGANITGAITVSAWFKKMINSGGSKTLVARGTILGTPSAEQYALFFPSYDITIPRFSVSNGTTRIVSVAPASSVPNGVWNHIVGTYNGADTTRLYVNGTQVDTDTTASFGLLNSTPNPNALGIGAIQNGAAGWFNGPLDDVRIYNRALSATEVKQLYNLGR